MRTQPLGLKLPAPLERVLLEAPELGKAFLVGGCVRDALLGRAVNDFDIEVYGLTYQALESVLSCFGRTDLVGRSFGVIKLKMGEEVFDFSIPRRDSKTAAGHKGFEIEFCPDIAPQEAAARRDFTINSLMFDPRKQEVLDYFGGLTDLEGRVLRHTSPAFPEDPLRVLRGMQFASRFVLSIAPETIELARSIKHTQAELAVERIREEWLKWAGRSVRPSLGLQFLKETEWLEYYPELNAMAGTPQEPEWHPEGDVFVHVCHCCDALAELESWQRLEEDDRINYMLAVLLHDIGKPATTERVEKRGQLRIVSPGHDEVGARLAESFYDRIQLPTHWRKRISPLVANHMAYLNQVSERAVRRLARRLEPDNIRGLCLVMTADSFGRPPLPKVLPEAVTFLSEKADELQVKDGAPKPLLLGRHLLELGYEPGPVMGEILEKAYEAQLEGKFFTLEEAKAWLRLEFRL